MKVIQDSRNESAILFNLDISLPKSRTYLIRISPIIFLTNNRKSSDESAIISIREQNRTLTSKS